MWQPPRSGGGAGNGHLRDNLAGLHDRFVWSQEEVLHGHVSAALDARDCGGGIQGNEGRGDVGLGLAVADGSAQRGHVPNADAGDLGRRFGQDAEALPGAGLALEGADCRERSQLQGAVGSVLAVEVADTAEIYDVVGTEDALVEHDDEGRAAGHDHGVVGVVRQEGDGFLDG